MKKRTLGIAAFLLVAGCMGGAALADDDPEVDCAHAEAQQDMNYCAALDFEKADDQLNVIYKKAKAYVQQQDKGEAEIDPVYVGAEAALKKAQRAWVDYRDGHCDGMGFQARGGTLEPLLVAGCKTELTNNRIKELKGLMDELGN